MGEAISGGPVSAGAEAAGSLPGSPPSAPAPRGGAQLTFVPWGFLDPFCTAVVQAVEEAVANALVANEEMVGRAGHRTPALPRDRVAAPFRSPDGNA